MKKITELTKADIANIKLVMFDVDGVTIKKGTEISEHEGIASTTLSVKTSNLSDTMAAKLLELKKYFTIAISSGRSSLYLTKIYYDILWDNAALISENGIFILFEGELVQVEKFDKKTLAKMRNIFVDLKVLDDEYKEKTNFEPKQFLITLHAYKDIPEVHEILKENDPEGEFQLFWNGEAFDISPKRIDKGTGLKNLCKFLKIDLAQSIAIGNGPNDKAMTDIAGIGVTTEPTVLPSDYQTTKSQHLGGEELVDRLLELARS